MTNLDALKEAISNKLYEKEPLAWAIISYLDKTNPKAHREIIDIFDYIIERRINQLINEYIEDDIDDL